MADHARPRHYGGQIGLRPHDSGGPPRGPDDPPDAVGEFARLVAARKAGDYRLGKHHTATLRGLGWRIMPVEPRRPGGGA